MEHFLLQKVRAELINKIVSSKFFVTGNVSDGTFHRDKVIFFVSLSSTVQALYYPVRLLFGTFTVLVALTGHYTNMFTFSIWNHFRYKKCMLNF